MRRYLEIKLNLWAFIFISMFAVLALVSDRAWATGEVGGLSIQPSQCVGLFLVGQLSPRVSIADQFNSVSAEYRTTLSSENIQKLLDYSPAHRVLWASWVAAAQNYQKVRPQLDLKDKYMEKMDRAVMASLTRHFDRLYPLVKVNFEKKVRLRMALDRIAKIEPDKIKYGLFKVQRAIDEMYDLDQYIDCK